MKRYNFNNAFCARCGEFVLKGNGFWHNFDGGTVLCAKCDAERDQQLAKTQEKNAYIKAQPTLFDNKDIMKGGETMSIIKRTIKVREVIDPQGNVVKAYLKWTNNPYAAEAGRSWYLVIDGKTHNPIKVEGITSDELARRWAGTYLRNLGYSW